MDLGFCHLYLFMMSWRKMENKHQDWCMRVRRAPAHEMHHSFIYYRGFGWAWGPTDQRKRDAFVSIAPPNMSTVLSSLETTRSGLRCGFWLRISRCAQVMPCMFHLTQEQDVSFALRTPQQMCLKSSWQWWQQTVTLSTHGIFVHL